MQQCWGECLYLKERESVTGSWTKHHNNSSIVFTRHGILFGDKIEDLMGGAFIAHGIALFTYS